MCSKIIPSPSLPQLATRASRLRVLGTSPPRVPRVWKAWDSQLPQPESLTSQALLRHLYCHENRKRAESAISFGTRAGESAGALAEAMRQIGKPVSADGPISQEQVRQAAVTVAEAFDPVRGGLLSGQRNKFPACMAMSLMLREYHRTCQEGKPEPLLLNAVLVTLDHMARGGI